MSTYAEKLKDPRWQKKRLEILKRDKFKCTYCNDGTKTLHVHHEKYKKEPWDVENEHLKTLCEECHGFIEDIKRQKFWEWEFINFIIKPDGYVRKLICFMNVGLCVYSFDEKTKKYIECNLIEKEDFILIKKHSKKLQ